MAQEKFARLPQKKPNAYGLYDMHGNAYEWCADIYDVYSKDKKRNPEGPESGFLRVLRGGSCKHHPKILDKLRFCCTS